MEGKGSQGAKWVEEGGGLFGVGRLGREVGGVLGRSHGIVWQDPTVL